MGNDEFDGQKLAEKLLKLNNSQQSIQSLSHWCISHRTKAKQIVETWDKLFDPSQKEQRVSFLYLANDILQNSKRKGSEFVNEFWKVIPTALKHVYENDEQGKKAVTRLLEIWEERKVFGSRMQGLKDETIGKSFVPLIANNGKGSNTIKIVKRDAHLLRIKLAVGGMPERIVSAFQSVFDEHLNEEAAVNKCNDVVSHVGKIMEDIQSNLFQGNQLGSTLINDMQEQEKELEECIEQLEKTEAARTSLLSQLKEALQDQESRQEFIRSQLQAARGKIEQANLLRKRLISAPVPVPPTTISNQATETTKAFDQNYPSVQLNSVPSHSSLSQPIVSFAPLKSSEEESKKAAAVLAAKLAASTSSAQMLTSVLSSLVAEEAASMNGSFNPPGFNSSLHTFPPEKKPKLEKPMAVSDTSSDAAGGASYFTPLQQISMANMPLAPSTSLQPFSQANQIQAAFAPPPPPPPPPPPLSPASQPAAQYVQSSGLMVGGIPYGYGGNNLPPPPPLPPHVAIGLSRPSSQPLQQTHVQQPAASSGYYRPPGLGYYGQSHPSTPPPVPRQ